jgi:hypothetical protein
MIAIWGIIPGKPRFAVNHTFSLIYSGHATENGLTGRSRREHSGFGKWPLAPFVRVPHLLM